MIVFELIIQFVIWLIIEVIFAVLLKGFWRGIEKSFDFVRYEIIKRKRTG